MVKFVLPQKRTYHDSPYEVFIGYSKSAVLRRMSAEISAMYQNFPTLLNGAVVIRDVQSKARPRPILLIIAMV